MVAVEGGCEVFEEPPPTPAPVGLLGLAGRADGRSRWMWTVGGEPEEPDAVCLNR